MEATSEGALPDLVLTIHEVDLEYETHRSLQREDCCIYAQVDLLGLGEGGVGHALRTTSLPPSNARVPLSLTALVPVEPGEPIWDPLQQALASDEEQDSDVYFVLYSVPSKSHDGLVGREELGTAHLNLEALFKVEREPKRERLPILNHQTERIGWMTVSLHHLAALRWARDGGDSGCRVVVEVSDLRIDPGAAAKVEQATRDRSLAVRIHLPGGLPPLRTPLLRLASGVREGTFAYREPSSIAPGSATHMALVAALQAEDDDHPVADVRFSLVVAAESKAGCMCAQTLAQIPAACVPLQGVRERELGSASINILATDGDASNVDLSLRDERRGSLVAVLRVSLLARDAVALIRQGALAAKASLAPPTSHELHALLAALRRNDHLTPLDLITNLSDDEEEQAKAKDGIDFALLDSLPSTSIHAAVEGGQLPLREEARAQKLRVALAEGAQRLAACAPKKTDFHREHWPAERVERLWNVSGMTALCSAQQQRQAWQAAVVAQLERSEQEAVAARLARRNRRRVSEAAGSGGGDGGERHLARRAPGNETALWHDAVALREVVATYEKLSSALHGALTQLAAEHLALAARCEESEVLLEGWDPNHAARWTPVVHRYAGALAACEALRSHADADRGAGEEGQRRRGRTPWAGGMDVERVEEFRTAVAVAVGGDEPAPPRRRHYEAEEGSSRPSADGGGAVPLTLHARRLRLRGDTAHRLRGEGLHLVLSLLPHELRLPPMRTVSVECGSPEVDLGFDGVISLQRSGGALITILASASSSLPLGPAALQLRVELHATGASRVARRVASASAVAGASPLDDAIILTARDGTNIADVQMSASAPQLLAAIRAEKEEAPTISLRVHTLSLNPELLRGRAAWGATALETCVWVEADLHLTDEPMRTPARQHDEGHVQFDHDMSLPVPHRSITQQRLVDALCEPPGGELRVALRVYCAGGQGTTLLAHGEVRASLHEASGEAWLRHITLKRSEGADRGRRRDQSAPAAPSEDVGKAVLTLVCHHALRAASEHLRSEAALRLSLGQLILASHLQRDVGLTCVWLEVQLPRCLSAETLKTPRVYATRGVLRLRLDEKVHVSARQIAELAELLTDASRSEEGWEQLASALSATEKEGQENGRASGERGRVNAEQLEQSVLFGSRDVAEGLGAKEKAALKKAREIVGRSGEAEREERTESAPPTTRARSRTSLGESTGRPAVHPLTDVASSVSEAHEAATKAEAELTVRFILKGEHWRGEVELGSAAVSLVAMARSSEEKLLIALSLVDSTRRQSGTLQVSLLAQHPLRAAWWHARRKEHLAVTFHSLRLEAWAVGRASGGGPLSVWVETDLAGIATTPFRTPELPLFSSELALHHPIEAWVPQNSEAARLLEVALRTSISTPIIFKVGGRLSDETSGHVLGEATLQLRQLLAEGGDIYRSVLPVLDAHGSICGELCLSMLAQEPTLALFGQRSWEREAIGITVHSVQLAAKQHALPERVLSSIWVEVDFMGIDAKITGMKSERTRRRLDAHAPTPLDAQWQVALDNDGPELRALRDALESEEEQDSDIYFVLHGAGNSASAQPRELGAAHVNAEEMLRTNREPEAESLPVFSKDGERVASISVSIHALEALQWVQRSVADIVTIGVRTDTLTLSKEWQKKQQTILGKYPLALVVELPDGMAQLRSEPVRAGASSRIALELDETVRVEAGSSAHLSLIAALEATDISRADVVFKLITAAEARGDREQDLGFARLNLHEILRKGADVEDLEVTLQDERRPERLLDVGTIRISLRALKALRRAERTVHARRLHAARQSALPQPLLHVGEDAGNDLGAHLLMSGPQPGATHKPTHLETTAVPARHQPLAHKLISAALLRPAATALPQSLDVAPSAARERQRAVHHVIAQRNASVVGDIESDGD
ncbi:hypothetical protein AB1Y20_021048 [Prymnesium parvum]|uniref:RPGRIP1 C-terminal domain-containing protein n=1 Tax=Prymnesium parvum TaxID=97485 RepID=A0AB34JJA5_PRYPA